MEDTDALAEPAQDITKKFDMQFEGLEQKEQKLVEDYEALKGFEQDAHFDLDLLEQAATDEASRIRTQIDQLRLQEQSKATADFTNLEDQQRF
jgi:hypothetical protein